MMVEREVDPSNSSMTVRSLTHLLDVGATTTAKSRRQHVRKLPERAQVVNPLCRPRTLVFEQLIPTARTNATSPLKPSTKLRHSRRGCAAEYLDASYGCTALAVVETLTRFFRPC
jgi:hypothetical protein